jgi:hypothetical protein
MAIEIQGRKPSAPAGKALRLEFWVWRPIQALVAELCADLLDDKTLAGMAFGRGTGPTSQAICTEIARRLEAWQAQHPEGPQLESGIRTTEEGRFLTEQELADNPTLKTRSPYQTAPRDLQRWIAFVKCCGGFEVW